MVPKQNQVITIPPESRKRKQKMSDPKIDKQSHFFVKIDKTGRRESSRAQNWFRRTEILSIKIH